MYSNLLKTSKLAGTFCCLLPVSFCISLFYGCRVGLVYVLRSEEIQSRIACSTNPASIVDEKLNPVSGDFQQFTRIKPLNAKNSA